MKNLDIERKEFSASSRYEYIALFCNEQIQDLMFDLESEIKCTSYYKHIIKNLFNKMKKEIKTYSIIRRKYTTISEEEFADVMIEMDDRYKKHIDILSYSISNSLLKDNIRGEDNSIATKLLTMSMLSEVGHCTRDFFVRSIQCRSALKYTSDALDYLHLGRFTHLLVDLLNHLLVKEYGVGDKIYEGKVKEAFNVFVINVMGENEFEKVIQNAGIKIENG